MHKLFKPINIRQIKDRETENEGEIITETKREDYLILDKGHGQSKACIVKK